MEEFWKTYLEDIPTLLEMTTDRRRATTNNEPRVYGCVDFEIDPGLTERLTKFAQSNRVTLYDLLMSVYQVLLLRYTRQEDIVVGTAVRNIDGRSNILAVRTSVEIKKQESFNDLQHRVAKNVRQSLANAELPFNNVLLTLGLRSIPKPVSVRKKPFVSIDSTYNGYDDDLDSGHSRYSRERGFSVTNNGTLAFSKEIPAEPEPNFHPVFQAFFTFNCDDVTHQNIRKAASTSTSTTTTTSTSSSSYRTSDADTSFSSYLDASRSWYFSSGLDVSADKKHLSRYDIELHVAQIISHAHTSSNLEFSMYFRNDLYFRRTIKRLAAHFQHLILSIVDRPTTSWQLLPLISIEERNLYVVDWNVSEASYPKQTIHSLFFAEADSYPNNVALIYHDEEVNFMIGENNSAHLKTITYQHLATASRIIAADLLRRGVITKLNEEMALVCDGGEGGVNTMIPIMLERSPELLATIYGVMNAGGAYVPLDVEYPKKRVIFILEELKAKILLTTSDLVKKRKVPKEFTGTVICIDKVLADANLILRAGSKFTPKAALPHESEKQNINSLLYVLYTSGTTGRPKGVMVRHHGLMRRNTWLQKTYPLGRSDRHILKTPYVFGISEWELVWPLLYGAQLVICKPGGHKDPDYMLSMLIDAKVNYMCQVPSMLGVMLEYAEAENVGRDLSVRFIISCGEALPLDTCKTFRRIVGNKCTLVNLYGPTEADMTFWECPKTIAELNKVEYIPIGQPIDNAKIYIVDQFLNSLPAGVPGELCFAGTATARGYVNLPDKTRQQFVKNPFADSGYMYRTGDLARWLQNGEHLQFLGRVDNQIKLRGFRIELSEIESVMGQFKGVKAVAVILHGKSAASQRLVAYVALSGMPVNPFSKDDQKLTFEPMTGPELDGKVKEIKAFISQKLASYMVPQQFIVLHDMPLTSRDKLNRKALPNADKCLRADKESKSSTAFHPATTVLQQQVHKAWQEVLNFDDPISIDVEFVDVGGNSLLAGKATSKIRAASAIQIPGTAMYQLPTIRKIAQWLDDHKETHGTCKENAEVSITRTWGGYSANSCSAVLTTIVGLILSSAISPVSFLIFIVLYEMYFLYGKWITLLLVPVSAIATILVLCSFALVLKHIVFHNAVPGSYPVWGSYYMRWWFSQNIVRGATEMLLPLFHETFVMNLWYSLLGANVGRRVGICTPHITEPSLVTLGDDVFVDRKVKIVSHAIENGYLILRPISIGAGSRLECASMIVQGSEIPPYTLVGPLSTTGLGDHRNMRKIRRRKQRVTHNCTRLFIGVPILLLMQTVPYIPAIYFMCWLYPFLCDQLPSPNDNTAYIVFSALTPWIYLSLPETYLWAVVLFKHIFVPVFKPGHIKDMRCCGCCHWGWSLMRWTLDGLVHNILFKDAMQQWNSTEVLSFKYRALGCRIGSRVHGDYFDIVEFDLIDVGDNCVFGSAVQIVPADARTQGYVNLHEKAQVLDHTVLQRGVVVRTNALCGSCTVGAQGHVFPPNSVSTGNVKGRAVLLRKQKGKFDADKGLSFLPPEEQKKIHQARAAHHSLSRWLCFNFYIMFCLLVITPIMKSTGLATLFAWIVLAKIDFGISNSWVQSLAIAFMLLPINLLLNFTNLLFYIFLKWIIVGVYKESDHPFYGTYHHKWMLMMLCGYSLQQLQMDIYGTQLYIWYLRLMGADIGDNACVFGSSIEFDLLHVGECASVGVGCDVTCHTVEHMVIKLAHVRVGAQGTMRTGAIVMPGGTMENGAVLMENSQVLKGETVGVNQVYAGLPADMVERDSAYEPDWKEDAHDNEIDDIVKPFLQANNGYGYAPVSSSSMYRSTASASMKDKIMNKYLAPQKNLSTN